MITKKVAIIGAGFSGLTLTWALTKKGFQVEVFEKVSRAGGLLGTTKETILVESAANALLASANVEELFADLNIRPIAAGFRSKKRFIFNKSPKMFPLSVTAAISGVLNFLRQKKAPQDNETVSAWTKRCLNQEFDELLVSPAFQGIYGDSSDNLSAELILGNVFDKSLKPKRGKLKGSIAPQFGMQQIITGLEKNIKIHFSSNENNFKDFDAVVIATAMDQTKSILKHFSISMPDLPMLPKTTATLGFLKEKPIKGFGCLFPSKEGFNSLGVLFNSDIFPDRGPLQSETWILNKGENILELISQDRKRLVGYYEEPIFSKITQYEKALPLYGLELKKFLTSDFFLRKDQKNIFEVLKNGARIKESQQPMYLTGNYLGGIGLAKILDYNLRLTERIQRDLA